MSSVEKNTLVRLYLDGLVLKDISRFMKLPEWQVREVMLRIMNGTVVFEAEAPLARAGLDWTLREEFALSHMRKAATPLHSVAGILARPADEVKRKWREMRARQRNLSEAFQ